MNYYCVICDAEYEENEIITEVIGEFKIFRCPECNFELDYEEDKNNKKKN